MPPAFLRSVVGYAYACVLAILTCKMSGRQLREKWSVPQDYVLRDGFPAAPGTSDVDDGESADLETSQ